MAAHIFTTGKLKTVILWMWKWKFNILLWFISDNLKFRDIHCITVKVTNCCKALWNIDFNPLFLLITNAADGNGPVHLPHINFGCNFWILSPWNWHVWIPRHIHVSVDCFVEMKLSCQQTWALLLEGLCAWMVLGLPQLSHQCCCHGDVQFMLLSLVDLGWPLSNLKVVACSTNFPLTLMKKGVGFWFMYRCLKASISTFVFVFLQVVRGNSIVLLESLDRVWYITWLYFGETSIIISTCSIVRQQLTRGNGARRCEMRAGTSVWMYSGDVAVWQDNVLMLNHHGSHLCMATSTLRFYFYLYTFILKRSGVSNPFVCSHLSLINTFFLNNY